MNREKILLALLPYWTPQIPPMGIACIKSYIEQHTTFNVRLIDANVEIDLRTAYDTYFIRLRSFIPKHKEGNFRSIANEVWQNHMMAYLHKENEPDYTRSVQFVVNSVFYHEIDDAQVKELNAAIALLYQNLEEYWMHVLEREKPSVVGVSAFIGTLPASLFVLKLTRRWNPQITTVIGGGAFYDQLSINSPNFDFFLEKTKDYLDKIIIGEGELLFLKLLQGELPRDQRVYTLADIGGAVVDLSSAPEPDVSDFDIQHYPTVGAYVSRSCPFQCRFCSDPVFWGKYRRKTPRQTVDELTGIYKRTGCQVFILTDLLMNPIVTPLAMEFIKSDIAIYWDGPLRVCDEATNIENTMMWRQGGYYRAEMGCESGSPRILKLMDKRITVEQIRGSLIAMAEAGIKTTTYWVIGFPGETEEDFQMTLDLVEELREFIYEAMNNAFWYYPGGPVNNLNWRDKSVPLYPAYARDHFIIQQWLVDAEPSREERYRRVNRFVEHRKKLGIPDINTLQHIYEADERWKKLHKNAAPPLVEFVRGKKYIDENKFVKEVSVVKSALKQDENWGF